MHLNLKHFSTVQQFCLDFRRRSTHNLSVSEPTSPVPVLLNALILRARMPRQVAFDIQGVLNFRVWCAIDSMYHMYNIQRHYR